jgi:hypothetical protein
MSVFLSLPLFALAMGAGATSEQSPVATGLRPLTEADLGPDALKSPGCYLHDGARVLFVGTKLNGVVNWKGDLLLVRRVEGRGPPASGASYEANHFLVTVRPDSNPGSGVTASSRVDRPALVELKSGKQQGQFEARWSCAL